MVKDKKRVLAINPGTKKYQIGILDIVKCVIRFATGHKCHANNVKFQEKPYLDEIK